MAEVIGLAASVIAVIQLMGKVTSLSYDYLSGVKRAPNDLLELVDELHALGKFLITLQNYTDENPESGTLGLLNAKDGPLSKCAQELQSLHLKLDGKKEIVECLKWPLKEKETMQHISRIERQKTLFTFALVVDHM